jgi:hypothetical protein
MARVNKIVLALFFISIMAAGCQKNFYTSKAKNNDCGCPNKKGMVGY